MTRNNADFRNQILFHGTNSEFSPGDIIKPRVATGASASFNTQPQMENFNPDTVAYATDHKKQANWYAKKSAAKNGGKPRVYQVVPIKRKNMEVDPNGGDNTGAATAYQNKSGFKVIKRIK